jgi:putative ABC transport system permease protein
MEVLLQDLRYSVKMLLKNPGFTAIAVLALALGIGANSAIFSVVNAILLRPLPYADAERLVWIWGKSPSGDKGAVSPPDFLDYRKQSQSFGQLAAFIQATHNLNDMDNPERISGAATSANFFDTLGVKPMLGRTFFAEEEQAGHDSVAILSHGIWQRRYGSDPNIVGKSIPLDGKPFTIVGVMPPGFNFPEKAEVWEVAPFYLKGMTVRKAHFLRLVGRLKPNVKLDQAQAEMDVVSGQLAQQYPDTNKGYGLMLVSLNEKVIGNIRSTLLMLLGAVGFVLLLACANVANMLLARAAGRQKEIAIRTALGARRSRLLRQLLTESVFLAMLGGFAGTLLAFVGTKLLIASTSSNVPRLEEVTLDSRVLIFSFAISILTGLVFGLVPALQASRPDLNETLKEGGRSSGGGAKRNRISNVLVVAQVALALVLAIGAGLMIRSFSRLQDVNPGFTTNNLLTMQIELPQTKFPKPPQRANFFNQLQEQIRAVPGVVSMATVSELPLSGQLNDTYFHVDGGSTDPSQSKILANYRSTSSGYFKTMGIPFKSGRDFTSQEVNEGAKVVVVNEMIAEKYFANQDPTGKRLIIDFNEAVPYEIVGVVGNIHHLGLDRSISPEMYIPQFPSGATNVVVQTKSNPADITGAVRGAVRAVDRDQPIANLKTMDELVEASVSQPQFRTLLLGVFAALALILAAVGIYGIISYSVAQGTHDIGLRIALGAQRQGIFKLILMNALRLVLIGLFIGLTLSLVLTRFLSNLLYGISATDPTTYLWVSLFLVGVALAASFIPAYRATRVNPLVALRDA